MICWIPDQALRGRSRSIASAVLRERLRCCAGDRSWMIVDLLPFAAAGRWVVQIDLPLEGDSNQLRSTSRQPGDNAGAGDRLARHEVV